MSLKKPTLLTQTATCLLVLASLVFTLNAIYVTDAYAQEVSLTTFPSTIRLQVQPSQTTSARFTITNQATEAIKLEIMLRSFKGDPTNDGKVIYLEGNDPAILKRVTVIDNDLPITSIELGPKQSKQLELKIETNKQEPTSDYYFSIIFLADTAGIKDEAPNEARASSIAQAGIAINVLLAVGPKELPLSYLEEFSTPFYRDSGPVPFTVRIKNRGPHFVTPKGTILIRNIFGQTVGRLDIQNQNILAGTSRSLSSTPYPNNANAETAKNTELHSQQAIWPEQFLLGFYTADLSIALSEKGPVLEQTIRFVAFPAKLLMLLGLLFIVTMLIALRIKRKIRD